MNCSQPLFCLYLCSDVAYFSSFQEESKDPNNKVECSIDARLEVGDLLHFMNKGGISSNVRM